MATPNPLNVNDIVAPGGQLNSAPSVAQTEAAQGTGAVTHVGTINSDFAFAYCATPYSQSTTLRFFATDVLCADLTLYAALNAYGAPITWNN